MLHQCGELCTLHLREGCLQKCCKVRTSLLSEGNVLTHFQTIDHDDDEDHMCAARIHTCGAPCSLQLDGKPLCTRKCVADWQVSEFFLVTVDLSEHFSREEHERHCCSLALSCPVKCQLCQSFCSTGDHFHALEADAIHLCG